VPALSSLVDDFDDDTIDATKWPSRSGGCVETGGRARVPVVSGGQYDSWASEGTYTLTGSGVYCQVYPPVDDTAGEIYGRVHVANAADGSMILGTQVSSGNNYIRFLSWGTSGAYSDPAPVDITYDPVEHAWVRIREDSGTVSWDTSPDGATWTNRRTLATPDWVGANQCRVVFDTARDSGSGYAEYDNVNTVPAPDPVETNPPVYLRRVAPARR